MLCRVTSRRVILFIVVDSAGTLSVREKGPRGHKCRNNKPRPFFFFFFPSYLETILLYQGLFPTCSVIRLRFVILACLEIILRSSTPYANSLVQHLTNSSTNGYTVELARHYR